ncbi:MAG TPA: DNA polymerase I [Spirochaetota bacterium]|nr:DNA polymerase I [Spirochaetota bacterium]HPJ33708.1 DNA polymerase I [Spirochaetota bacterium]
MKKKLFIIDGHALCYRAYFAFIRNPLINSNGQNTSAIYGFARMLLKLIKEQSPDYLAVAFDPPVKSFRFKIYEEYKANRQKMPDDMRSQVEEIKTMVKTLGLPLLEFEEFEADDILGTVAEKYSSDKTDVYLVTGDKDAYQLVHDNVRIYASTKGISEYEIYDREGVINKTGLPPEKIIDYMALMGDTSDNVPGIKGIGEKTALKLITEYGSLEALFENAGSIKGKTGELIRNGHDMALLSRELVTIRRDVPIEIKIDEMEFNGISQDKASEYFNGLEMGSIVTEFFQGTEKKTSDEKEQEKKDYRTVRTEKELDEMISEIEKAAFVSVDTETDSLQPVEAEIVGLSFSVREQTGWYLPVMSRGLFSEDYPDSSVSLPKIKPLLENPDIKKIGQNIKYDLLVLRRAGIELKGIEFDTMIASYLINPSDRRHNMDDLAEQYLNYKTITFKELTGTGKNAVPITEVPLDRLAEYAAEDADITLRLHNALKPLLEKNSQNELFTNIEMPLMSVLAEMEQTGVKIDTKHFDSMKKDTAKKLVEVEKNIYSSAGQEFNINSTKELSSILFEKLGLRTVKKTKTGFSTDIQVLETLRGSHEIIDHLITYRTLSKLQSTYIDSLPKLISPVTGRIHTSYNQTVAATGRLSSSDPNLQNIPIRDDFGRQLRKGFIPEKGFIMMSADYSQIELRLAAHYSDDPNMLSAFREGIDIHNMTASSVFGVPFEEISPDMRRQAKIINFATIYGVSPYGLSQQAEISMKDAAEFIKKYFETYPGFRDYIDRTVEFAKKNGYVETLMGRRRPVPEINSDTVFRREGAERVAINTPLQGTSADMIKIAMINISRELSEKKLQSKMIMQVHDELVFEVHEEELEEMKALVREKMETALSLNVPIVVEIGTGNNWEEAH